MYDTHVEKKRRFQHIFMPVFEVPSLLFFKKGISMHECEHFIEVLENCV
jgi:hypothetical protein